MYDYYLKYGLLPNKLTYAQRNAYYRSQTRDSKTDEILEIILESLGNERDDEVFYEFLINSTPRREDKEIISTIRDDEKKHRTLLSEIYKNLTGMYPKVESSSESNTTNKITYMEGLEKAFMDELKAFEKYRKVLANMADKDNYNKMFEIMSDEMKHAIKYNYLITKNMK